MTSSNIIPFPLRAAIPPRRANSACEAPQPAAASFHDPVSFNNALQMNSKTRNRLLSHLIQREGGRCFYCDRCVNLHTRETLATKWPDPLAATIDHIVPRAARGGHRQDNTVLACFDCNNARKDADAATFLFERALDAVREEVSR